MSDDTPRKKIPAAPSKRELAVQAIAAYRDELTENYKTDLATWKARRAAEIERIRTKLNRPGWAPTTQQALAHIGTPPLNPLTLPFWSFKLP